MATGETSEQELYEEILQRLRELGAAKLVRKIEQVVGRGIIVVGDEAAFSKNTKLLRPMQAGEALAVALEFLVTTLQVPLMVEETKAVFACVEIVWRPDEPLIRELSPETQPMPTNVDVAEFKKQLKELVKLSRELKIVHPEVV